MPKSALKLTAELLAAALLTAVVAVSCNTTGCSDNRSSIPLAGFYASDGTTVLQLDSLEIGGVGAPDDSLLLGIKQKATDVYLPLRQTADRASFFIRYRMADLDFPELYDTITFVYTPIRYFASEECGAMLRYRINRLTYTRHLIDSVALLAADSTIINVDSENMKIFFRTDD